MTDHADMVRTLAKDGESIRASITSFGAHILHMAVGISGEAGELAEALIAPKLDLINVVEELGDIEFYMEGLRQGVGLTRNDVLKSGGPVLFLTQPSVGIQIYASHILDAVKKCVIYEKEIELPVLIQAMYAMEAHLGCISVEHNLSHSDALAANIAKLSKRYVGLKYSNQAAQERKDKIDEKTL